MKMPNLSMLKLDFFVSLLNRCTEGQKQLIFAAAIVLVVVLDSVLFIGPALRVIYQDAPKIAPLKQELKRLAENERDKVAIQKKWDELKSSLEKVNQHLFSLFS